MRSTRPRRSRGPDAAGRRPRGRALGRVLLLAAAAGCATRGEVHERYDELGPSRIDVPEPENRTVVPLDEIGYGGLLQRVITGPRVYPVTDMLRQGLRDALLEKGYDVADGASARYAQVDFREPVGDASVTPPFDAVLYSTVEGWSERRAHPAGVALKLRVALHRVPSGERLYEAVHVAHMSEDRHGPDSQGRFLESGLRRAAAGALADLPERAAGAR